MLIFSAIVAWGLWGFFNKTAQLRVPAPQISFLVALVNIIASPFYYFVLRQSGETFRWNKLGITFAILSGLCSGVAGLCYTYALNGKNVGTVTGLTSAYPIVTVLLSMALLNEKMTLSQGVGFILVLVGVIFLGH